MLITARSSRRRSSYRGGGRRYRGKQCTHVFRPTHFNVDICLVRESVPAAVHFLRRVQTNPAKTAVWSSILPGIWSREKIRPRLSCRRVEWGGWKAGETFPGKTDLWKEDNPCLDLVGIAVAGDVYPGIICPDGYRDAGRIRPVCDVGCVQARGGVATVVRFPAEIMPKVKNCIIIPLISWKYSYRFAE